MTRRELIKLSIPAAGISFLPTGLINATLKPNVNSPFRFCLNMSTIMGQKPGLLHSIEIAAAAGYDGVELWVRDIQQWLEEGNKIAVLAKLLADKKLQVENIISFTEWMVDDDAKRAAALVTLEKEMQLVAALGGKRIAAPPSGVGKEQILDYQKAGDRYRETLKLGRKYGVMPLLEFWGSHSVLYNFGQALHIAAAANEPDARILPDVYHLHRGGSEFNCLNLANGKVIDIIHMNDYPADKPVNEQTDADRVYPGDGAAPFKQILTSLKNMGGSKTLSLELFNRAYWQQDALTVAKTGLEKMKAIAGQVM